LVGLATTTGEVTDAFQRSLAEPCAERKMNTTDATLTNGRYELPAHARGVLVLADPPEAGWRLEWRPDEEVAPEAEQAAGTSAIVLGSGLPHRGNSQYAAPRIDRPRKTTRSRSQYAQ
jgi:hypothetical protein